MKNDQKIVLAWVIFVWVLAAFPVQSSSQINEGDIEVRAEGCGANDSDAMLQAKRNAIEKGIGIFLVSETEVRNFQTLKDRVITKTAGSVKRIDVLEKQKRPKDIFIRIKAIVSLATIKEDLIALKILVESMDRPRMMVFIHEENGNLAETTVIDYLMEKEFQLIDPSISAALMKKDEKLTRLGSEGDPVADARIGSENGAEYVIVGKVVKSVGKKEVLEGTGLISGQAGITTRVINCSTAEVIASKSSHAAAAHHSKLTAITEATEKAAKKLMDRQLFEKIVASFQDMVNNGIDIVVTISGVANFPMQKAIQSAITEIPEVIAVNKRSFNDTQLQVTVRYKGKTDTFAEALDGLSVEKKKFAVTGSTGNRGSAKIR